MTDAFETVQSPQPPIEEPAFYNDLETTLAHAWTLLETGAKDRRSAFHAPSVASIGLDGSPQQRSMILRKVDVANRRLRFNTDLRSTKIQELKVSPAVSVLAYSAADKVQLRLAGRADLDASSALADAVWSAMRDQSRAAYAQPAAPGAMIEAPAAYVPPLELRANEPTAIPAREHFCLVQVEITSLEWVYLHLHGNRRAHFCWPNGIMASRWLAP
ncbi:MAG: pyridoxamine 5'-phosphate oxidase family protein [Rhodocyclaceae bacterium]|nr:pyridoxamine 5'-phosphate oxidase family protein [Rhodocyclaceae bacterium]